MGRKKKIFPQEINKGIPDEKMESMKKTFMELVPATEEKAVEKVETRVTEKTIRDFLFGSGTKLTDQQQSLFIQTAVGLNLNPLKREIYAIPHQNKEGGYDMSIVTGYETYLRRAEASGKLAGWRTWVEGQGPLMKACIEIIRKDFTKPFYHEVFFTEYNQPYSPMWKYKPQTMLKKTAISQGFRLAFSIETDGLPYTAEEMPVNGEHEVFQRETPKAIEEKIEAGVKPVESVPAPMSPQKEAEIKAVEDAQKIDFMMDFDGVVQAGIHKGKRYGECPSSYIEQVRDSMKDPSSAQIVLEKKLSIVMVQIIEKLGMNEGDVMKMSNTMFGQREWNKLSYPQRKEIYRALNEKVKS